MVFHQPREKGMSTVSPSQIETPLILAIDIGTTAARTIVFDRLGRAVEALEAREAHEILTTTEGTSEADPDALLDVVWRCIDRVFSGRGPFAPQISGVGVCTFVGNILGVDKGGQAITPLMTYADTRAGNEVAGPHTEWKK